MNKKTSCYLVAFLGLAFAGACITSAQAQQPANTLSIVTYGASTGSADNKTAIQNCINAAQSQGKGVWIPAGTWKIQSSLSATGITITGAGMTSSIIYRQQNSSSIVATELSLVRCTVRDLGIDGNGTARGVNASYGMTMRGVGWLVERVRVSHSDAGMWMSGSNGTVQNCQVATAYADGININNSNGPDGLGANLTVQNCSINTTHDDSIAINSQGTDLGRQNMQNPKVLNCTTTNSVHANGIRIAGGVSSTVQNNTTSNVIEECGIVIAEYGSTGFPCVNAVVSGNTVNGCGSWSEMAGIKIADGASATISNNRIVNSAQAGFLAANGFGGGTLSFTFGPQNVIDHPATSGIRIWSGATGSGTFRGNIVQSLNSGQTQLLNSASGTFTTTIVDNNWQAATGGVLFYRDSNYTGAVGQALTIGNYTIAQLAAKGVPNDWASSVKIPAGRTLIMYSDDNFSGTSWTRTADSSTLSSLSPNANDTVSSVRVQ